MEKEQIEFLNMLDNNGIDFVILTAAGYDLMHICVDDIPEILKDRHKWEAARYNIPEKTLTDFNAYIKNNMQCTGTTNGGHQCKNQSKHHCTNPSRFKPGITDRCSVH